MTPIRLKPLSALIRACPTCGHHQDQRKREPLLEHVRDVWTLQGTQSNCTAAIYRNDFGLELRIELAGELMHSQLSRFGEQPLIVRAERVKADLIEQGWWEQI